MPKRYIHVAKVTKATVCHVFDRLVEAPPVEGALELGQIAELARPALTLCGRRLKSFTLVDDWVEGMKRCGGCEHPEQYIQYRLEANQPKIDATKDMLEQIRAMTAKNRGRNS